MVVRERPRCSANVLNVIPRPESLSTVRFDAVNFLDFIGLDASLSQPHFLRLTNDLDV